MIETEITQKSKVRGRKRMKWHEIGKSVTGIKEFKTLKKMQKTEGNGEST